MERIMFVLINRTPPMASSASAHLQCHTEWDLRISHSCCVEVSWV